MPPVVNSPADRCFSHGKSVYVGCLKWFELLENEVLTRGVIFAG